jgi:AcrR family transcriptional regulator
MTSDKVIPDDGDLWDDLQVIAKSEPAENSKLRETLRKVRKLITTDPDLSKAVVTIDMVLTPKRQKGRPASNFSPDQESRRMVANMAAHGLTIKMITALTGMSKDQLYRYYGDELRTESAKKDLKVAEIAYMQAVGGPDADWEKSRESMTRWWLEKRVDLYKPQPPKVTITILMGMLNLEKLADEQLFQLQELLLLAAPDPDRDASEAGMGETAERNREGQSRSVG